MKRVLVAIGVLAVFGARPASAQSADDCVPSVLNIPEAKYPCLYADHRALFRVVAPDAQKVRLRMGPGFDMTKGPDGIWSVTTTPLVVGFHFKAFLRFRQRQVSSVWPLAPAAGARTRPQGGNPCKPKPQTKFITLPALTMKARGQVVNPAVRDH